MAIYGTILREDSSNRRESIDMECVSLIPLPTCLFPSLLYPTFLRPRLVDAMRAAYPFLSLPLPPFLSLSLSHFGSSRVLERRSTIPPGIFRDLATETTGGTRHDSIRRCADGIKKKKKEKNFESTDLGLRARWGSRLVSAWFDPWKWLSGIELSIDEDLMLAGRIDFPPPPPFSTFNSSQIHVHQGEGRGGPISFMPGEWKIGE